MALGKEDIVKLLDNKKIKYEMVEHQPVFTIEEMLECELPHPDMIAKNLFIRDDKKRKYYLITCLEDKKINLKEFRKEHDTRPLTFASEEDLKNFRMSRAHLDHLERMKAVLLDRQILDLFPRTEEYHAEKI